MGRQVVLYVLALAAVVVGVVMSKSESIWPATCCSLISSRLAGLAFLPPHRYGASYSTMRAGVLPPFRRCSTAC